mmetsp:Transcript_24143/g.43278  ORF Transcript_24143/g.43278 Transcript_24143/m.43278 type:complete len:84 (-) Transcript_24143:54-305(-)
MGNAKNENSNDGNNNRRGGQGHENKNLFHTKNINNNQPGFEQPIKEAEIGNEEDNHRNANGRHCYNRNVNVRCQTQRSTINLL